jgi:anti-anti-sigma regulatory factor
VPVGALNADAHHLFEAVLESACNARRPSIIVDMSHVTAIEPSIAHFLNEARERIRAQGITMFVVSAPEASRSDLRSE